jgi:hypothetical protein
MMMGAVARKITIRMNAGKLAHDGIEKAAVPVFVRNECLPPSGDDKQKEQGRKKDAEEHV